MVNISRKMKEWYRGTPIPYSIDNLTDLQRDKFGEPQTPLLPDRFNPPVIAKVFNGIGRFCRRYWKWIIGILFPATLAMIGLHLASLVSTLSM